MSKAKLIARTKNRAKRTVTVIYGTHIEHIVRRRNLNAD